MESHGFTEKSRGRVEEFTSDVQIFVHQKTGAELFLLKNADQNKVFGIGFRTVPSDSSGVFHIIEHSVLCGSTNFPLKAPFNVAMEGSLQTFLNAYTMPDCTVYPVATTNNAEFQTLTRIYLDAVFNPFLTPRTLEQEGTCLELREVNGDLRFGGVVYNEMKGANSTPSRKLWRETVRGVCPVGPYSVDSGGEPESIRTLTYQQYRQEYLRCYHPSNSRIFIYGDNDQAQMLSLLDGYLSNYERQEPQPSVPLQARFDAPKRRTVAYDPSKPELTESEHVLTVGWLLPEPKNALENFIAELVGDLLVGSSAAPLQKALIESGLGESPMNYGMQNYLREPVFAAGLMGIAPSDLEKVEALILSTIKQVATDGFDPNLVEASLNSLEFSLREQNYGREPTGVHIVEELLGPWLNGRDPITELRFQPILSEVRQKIARGEKFLEEFVRKNLIDNPHRCTTTFEPVAGLSKEMEDQERKELDTRLQKLSRRDRTELVADTWERIRLKDSKDSPEALTCIPILGISDLDPRNRPVLREERTIGGISCVFHPISSRGIAYLDLCFDFSSLPPELLPAYGVLQGAWSELGSTRRSYDELENVIGTNTGGVKARHLVLPVLGSPSVRTLLSLHGSALVTKLGALREVLSEVLLEVNLSNRARLSDIAGVWKAGAEKSIAGRGHELVAATLRAHYSRSEQVDQLISGGPKRLHRLRQLVTDIDSNWEKVEDQLRKVHRSIVNRNALQLHVACDSGDFDRVAHEIEKLLGVLPTANVGKSSWPLGSPERMVGLAAPCPINYCGMGCDLFSTGYQFHGSARVATALLNNKFLWQEVREKGGAYGVRFGFNNVTGEGLFWSYRDPHIGETLQRFAGSARWLSGTDFSDEDVRKAIISVIAELDTPVHASAEAGSSFSRYLMGVSDEYRQRSRTELLSTTRNDVRAFAAALQQALSKDPTVAVFGDEARLRQSVADGLPYQLKIERVV